MEADMNRCHSRSQPTLHESEATWTGGTLHAHVRDLLGVPVVNLRPGHSLRLNVCAISRKGRR